MLKKSAAAKKEITLKSEQFSKFINWMFEKTVFYGDPWLSWWKERGQKDFLEYTKKRGITFIEEVIDGKKS